MVHETERRSSARRSVVAGSVLGFAQLIVIYEPSRPVHTELLENFKPRCP